ncbi:MAG: hypothetical protein JJT94_15030 [Bernardetiaceae bacterium]|nr:hypothetical protein [Bernardetiaceae bacterium]
MFLFLIVLFFLSSCSSDDIRNLEQATVETAAMNADEMSIDEAVLFGISLIEKDESVKGLIGYLELDNQGKVISLRDWIEIPIADDITVSSNNRNCNDSEGNTWDDCKSAVSGLEAARFIRDFSDGKDCVEVRLEANGKKWDVFVKAC